LHQASNPLSLLCSRAETKRWHGNEKTWGLEKSALHLLRVNNVRLMKTPDDGKIVVREVSLWWSLGLLQDHHPRRLMVEIFVTRLPSEAFKQRGKPFC